MNLVMSTRVSPAIDVSTQLDIVGVSRRRLALEVLAANETPLTLRDLATEIVTREHDASLPDVPANAVMAVHVSLSHVHIPKLVDADVIDYDETRQHIQEVNLEHLEPVLSVVVDIDLE